MKATIDFDDQLYRRLKIEAAKRGRSVRELVAEGVRHVLDAPQPTAAKSGESVAEWKPAWLGSLNEFATAVNDHSMDAVRESVNAARTRKRPR